MKKLINYSFAFAILGLVGGVFYREFTKLNGFEGTTALSYLHPHLILLGSFLCLLLVLLDRQMPLTETKKYNVFFQLYRIALPFMVIMMGVRGVLQVRGTVLTGTMDAAISGVAGLSHIMLGTALVFLFLALKEAADKATR